MTDLNDLNHHGVGLAGFTLSFYTLMQLIENGIISKRQAIEIVEHALLNLETQSVEPEVNPASRDVIAYAHALLEQLRQTLPRPE